MSVHVVYRKAAATEFVDSAVWYENQRDGLGEEFIEEVETVVQKIAEDPLRCPVVFADIREAVVARFPFAIYYRVKSDRVVILAVFHCSRDPAVWQSRR